MRNKMSNHKEQDKHRRNDLKSLPSEVLLKARSTLVSLVKSKQEPQRKPAKDPKKKERLKSSRSEPDFDRKVKHRSRIDEPRDFAVSRPRPLSVGAMKRYEDDIDFHCNNYKEATLYPKETNLRSQFDSTDDVSVHSRLAIPVMDRLDQDMSERPRKKLSFREPEIVGSASATLGRSSKLMGVNSLTRRPNRQSLRSEMHSSLDRLDSDLESQAMKIVRTVGQAFEVCYKLQECSIDNPQPSTSSAPDTVVTIEHNRERPSNPEPASESGASGSAASTSQAADEPRRPPPRPRHVDTLLLPGNEGKRFLQGTIASPECILEMPECVTKLEDINLPEGDTETTKSAKHLLQLFRERIMQQAQQTRAAVAQLLLVRDQLAAEQTARCEAQSRTHQLLIHNKELLEHIASLVNHLQEQEKGIHRPINAQQLTLLPQMKAGGREPSKSKSTSGFNGNCPPVHEELIDFISKNSTKESIENNNLDLDSFFQANNTEKTNGTSASSKLGNLTTEQYEDYVISKFKDMTVNNTNAAANAPEKHKYCYQNIRAFPDIPLVIDDFIESDRNHELAEKSSSSDECGQLAQAMSIGHSQNSLCSTSSSSNDTSDCSKPDEALPYIMPLSHNGTLTATGEDGRVRVIVPVSPSASSSGVGDLPVEVEQEPVGATLKVPGAEASAAPISRSTSEKGAPRKDLKDANRSQWSRHTTD